MRQRLFIEMENEEFREIDRFEGLQNGWGAIGWDENQEKSTSHQTLEETLMRSDF